ncbi:MAG: hypothetical protein DRI90_26340, partial [Deltaproteobacteria bacterium]
SPAASGTGGGGGTGGGSHGGGLPCHPPDLVDTFDGPQISSFWLPVGGDITGISNGRLVLTPIVQHPTDQWGGIEFTATCEVQDCSIWVEVPTKIDLITGGSALHLRHDDGNFSDIRGNKHFMEFEVQVDGESDQVEYPYDEVAHRWWRMREEAGQFYLETSPNGSSWVTQHQVPSPSYLDSVSVQLVLWLAESQPAAGIAEFDNVNVVP